MAAKLSVLLLFIFLFGRSKDVESYSKVLTMGSGGSDNGPKIYKAMNMDLIFPKTFNSSENVISTTQTTSPQRFNVEPVESLLSTTDGQFTPGYSSLQTLYTAGVTEPTASPAATVAAIPTNHYHPSFVVAADDDNHDADNLDEEEMMEEEEEVMATLPPPATGRAVDYRPAYPFSQLLTPNSKGYSPSSASAAAAAAVRSRPAAASVFKSPGTTGQQRVVYPSYQASRIPSRAEIDKLSGKEQILGRSIIPNDIVALPHPLETENSFPPRPHTTDTSLTFTNSSSFINQSNAILNVIYIKKFKQAEVANYESRSLKTKDSSKLSKFSEALIEAETALGRAKKYSYFYIARTIWYVPLYFCVWLSFYTVWLIIRSTGFHKAMIHKKYKDKMRSFDDDKEELREIIDELTVIVVEGIMKYNKLYSQSK